MKKEQDYSKRELDERFKDIQESLKRIEIQTTKHNGRLSSVERWMYTLAGAIAVIGFLLGANMLNL